MLSEENRLRSTNYINKVYKEGQRVSGRTAALFFRRTEQGKTRFAFVVSGKQINRIADRNLIKRRMRAIIRRVLGDVKKGFDIIINGKKMALSSDEKQLEEEIVKLLKKAKLWKE